MNKKVHTVVEIFDTVHLQNNIVASIAFGAEKTVLLYENVYDQELDGVCAFLKTKCPGLIIERVGLDYKTAKACVQEAFKGLKSAGESVLVEINGGSSIVGNYAAECAREHGYPCVAIDLFGREVINIEHGEAFQGSLKFEALTFQEILLLQGRTYNRHMHMSAEKKDYERILHMAEYAFAHPSDFKFFYDFVHNKSDGQLSEPGLSIVLDKPANLSGRILKIFREFETYGFISDFKTEQGRLRFRCADEFAKEMLSVKGSWLELYVYILAKESGLFSEVYQSVMIGWDLKRRPKFNVENEIDVVLMKGGIPIFVSCKMTSPKPDDLNEIYALAENFGGYGAVAALATTTDVEKRARTLYNRAQEMGVALIDCQSLNRKGLMEIFAKF